MFPRDTCNYSANGSVANSKFIRKRRTGHPQVVKAAYRPNIGVVQFCMSISLAAWSTFRVFTKRVVIAQYRGPIRVVSLICKVSHVLGVCCKEKMTWIYANRIIACMAYFQAVRDWSMKIAVYKTMGANVLPVDSDISISTTYGASPFPTMLSQKSKAWKRHLIHKPFYRIFIPSWHKHENRRQAKVLSACSWPRLLDDGKMFLVRNTFIGYNRAT